MKGVGSFTASKWRVIKYYSCILAARFHMGVVARDGSADDGIDGMLGWAHGIGGRRASNF